MEIEKSPEEKSKEIIILDESMIKTRKQSNKSPE